MDSASHSLIVNEIVSDCETLFSKLMSTDVNDKDSMETFFTEINDYIRNHGRLLYSTIFCQVTDMSEQDQYDLLGICESLLNQAKSKGDDTYLFLLRVYDHVNLATEQHLVSSRLDVTLQKTITIQEETICEQENLRKELKYESGKAEEGLKEIQKDYITILGIFASIVLAFTGGLVFNTSVLQYMHKNSIYKMIFILILLMQSTLHLVYLLFDFIHKIYKEKFSEYPRWLKMFNLASIVVLVLDILMYFSLTQ